MRLRLFRDIVEYIFKSAPYLPPAWRARRAPPRSRLAKAFPSHRSLPTINIFQMTASTIRDALILVKTQPAQTKDACSDYLNNRRRSMIRV
jgi:hypothetical protein